MGTDDAEQALLAETTDRHKVNEKNSLQRRRHSQATTNSTTTAFSAEQNHQNEDDFHFPSCDSTASRQQFSLNQVIFLLSIYLGAGTLCFFLVRHQIEGRKTNEVLDAIYFCVVTMTTVGYGDLVPHTMLAKLLACAYVFSGMALVGLILGKAADYVVEKQEFLLVRAIHMRESFGQSELIKEAETYKVEYKFFTSLLHLFLLIIVGTLFLHFVEDLELMDAFYCVCSTITTLGYGDESFSTKTGRVFAVFWILGSTICLAQFFLYLAELCTEGRRRALADWVLTRTFTPSDLEAADLDHDKVVR